MTSVFPSVLWIAGHLTSDLGDRAALSVFLGEELAQPIVEALDFDHDVIGNSYAQFLIHILDVVDRMGMVSEAADALRDFGLSIA